MAPGAALTCSEQVCDQPRQGVFQVELQQLDGFQTVRFLFVRRSPSAGLEQRQVLTVLHPVEQLQNTTTMEEAPPPTVQTGGAAQAGEAA